MRFSLNRSLANFGIDDAVIVMGPSSVSNRRLTFSSCILLTAPIAPVRARFSGLFLSPSLSVWPFCTRVALLPLSKMIFFFVSFLFSFFCFVLFVFAFLFCSVLFSFLFAFF